MTLLERRTKEAEETRAQALLHWTLASGQEVQEGGGVLQMIRDLRKGETMKQVSTNRELGWVAAVTLIIVLVFFNL